MIDREKQSVTIFAHEVGKPSLPFFIKFKNVTNEFIFSPTQIDVVKDYSIQIDITDYFGESSSSKFKIFVYDSSNYNLAILPQN